MSTDSYEVLRAMTRDGNLKIYHLIAPPRSSSTALERALSNSPDISGQINDPWSLYDTNRESQTYTYILERVRELAKETQSHPICVVIKDIADYIPPGDAWLRMAKITQHTIFLVREPLLAAESMMRIMSKELDTELGQQTASAQGYASWGIMQSELEAARDYRPYSLLYEQLFREEQPIHRLPEMWLPVLFASPLRAVQDSGYVNHDTYATSKGYDSWKDLCSQVSVGDSPRQFEDLLRANFACRIMGWSALEQHMEVMQRTGLPYDVIDATLYRAMPDTILGDALKRAGLMFASGTVKWSESSKVFRSDYDGPVPYYDKVIQSASVLPPTETPAPLNMFPDFIMKSLSGIGGAFDVYRRALYPVVTALTDEQRQALEAMRIEDKLLESIDPVFRAFYLDVLGDRDGVLKLERQYPEHTAAIDAIKMLPIITT